MGDWRIIQVFLYDCIFIRSVAKVWGSGTKIKKAEYFGSASTPQKDVKYTGLSGYRGRWGRDVFYKTGLKTIRTSRKPLTEKPYEVVTSRTERQAWRNIQTLQPDLKPVL